jgi:hypothetical protein
MDSRSCMTRKFSLNGRALEVRAIHSIHVWRLGVFENGHALSGDIARLSEIDVKAAFSRQGVDLLEETMVRVQVEIEKGKLPLPQPNSGESRIAK